MATVQHSALTDPNLHEPKGVSTAAAGKVYVANGSGSGVWQYPAGHAYADMYITGSSTAQTLAASSAKSKLNPTGAWTANGNQAVTMDAANGQITVLQAGVYQLDFWIVFETAAISGGAAYNFHYAINGTPSTRKVYVKKTTNGVDTLNVSAVGYATLAANDIFSMYVGGDGTSSGTAITPKEAGLSLLLVDPA
jgi:hypothetical protein